nr:hypothetical protein [Tanacetum cinerariifolium]
MKLSMNNCRHPRVQHPSERARAGYAFSSNRTLAHLISTSGSSKASSLLKR